MRRNWRESLLGPFQLDRRSLAIFRIVIGSTLVADLLCDLADAEGLYTSAGALPRTLWARLYENTPLWCVHALGDTPIFVKGMLVLQLVFALMLLVGYRTRLATVASWVFFVSLLNRNIYATDGGDEIAGFLLFSGMFLPLGAKWSVDSLLRPSGPPGSRVMGLGSVFLVVQMMLMYCFAGLAKLREGVWWTGEAMDIVLRWTEFTKPYAEVLRHNAVATRLVTHLTPWAEILLPLLFLSNRARFRGVAVLVFALLHVCIGIALRLSFFCAYSWAGLAALIPSDFWDYLSGQTSRGTDLFPAQSRLELWLRRLAIPVALCSAYSALPALLGEERVWYPLALQYVNDFDYGYQNWNLFRDPNPTPGWFRAKATLRNGQEVDLLNGAPYTDAKPAVPSEQFPSRRWLSFMMHAPQDWDIGELRENFARFTANHWNDSHRPMEQVKSLVVVYFREQNLPFRPTLPLDPYDYAVYEEGAGETPSE